jgi:hypothetical protein
MTGSAVTNTNREEAKFDAGEYNRLVAHAKVQAIRLINSRYDIKPVALSAPKKDLVYNVSYRLLDWHCDGESLTLSGTWEYTATCMDRRRKLLTVTAKYLVTYRLSAVCDVEAGRQFLERVGRFAAYPYFRSTFAILTQQSGIVLHPLPIISEQPRWVTPPADTATPGSQPAAPQKGPASRKKATPVSKKDAPIS